jgi:hypothetical protein
MMMMIKNQQQNHPRTIVLADGDKKHLLLGYQD